MSAEEIAQIASRFIASCFQGYYASHPPPPPDDISHREFGFMYGGSRPFMQRHLAFGSPGSLHEALLARTPLHAYYSTAYYKYPGASRMDEKVWLGADLIFDLDADHLKGAESMTYEEQLANVKEMVRTLVEEYLIPDFGFDDEAIHIVFSGGRGYHIHVTSEEVRSLNSAQRREIVDYIEGTGLTVDELYDRRPAFDKQAASGRSPGPFSSVVHAYALPPDDAPGWKGRLARSLRAYIRRLVTLPPEEATREIMGDGIGKASARRILDSLRSRDLSEGVPGEVLEAFPDNATRNRFLRKGIAQVRLSAGETDEPVTTDIKRLIRLPGSLHGKTGLRVTPLTRRQFDSFDPLHDAVALSDRPVRVGVLRDTSVSFMGGTFSLKAGPATVPEYLAVFLVGRRAALPPGAKAPDPA